ncbi:hypothetical protein ACFL27_05580 [candidate division CSSED10-310 bacterium]|uniref:Uncharacterized protein n=1 Tax=candidate division CSSED10-310 bacterium TaxID=2855610 RepID=A0ABV6YU11_UNCC1
MSRKSLHVQLFVWLICIAFLAMMMVACTDDDDDPTQAAITIRSDPNPVPYAYYENGYYYWTCTFYVEETAGIGATLTEWYTEYYDSDGNHLDTQTFSVQNFRDWFVECDAQSNAYIPGLASVCSSFWYRTASSHGWYADNYMRFTDDEGNDFWAEGRFTLLAP